MNNENKDNCPLYCLDDVKVLPPPEIKDLRYPLMFSNKTKLSTCFVIDRLKELASEHLHCNLDDNEPGYIPPDLKEGTYRWYLYMYSNMYKKDDHCMTREDREILFNIAYKFKEEHLISWTRDHLIEIDRSKLKDLNTFLLHKINNTDSFFELKTCIYTIRSLKDKCLTTDPFVLEILPEMKEFIVNEKV